MRKTAIVAVVLIVMLLGTVFAGAASDPNVTIVSPGQTVCGTTLLISVKITAPQTIRVSAYEQMQLAGDELVPIDPDKIASVNANDIRSASIMTAETFTCPDNLRFYSKQINDVTPGLYKVVVETMNGDKVTATTSTWVVVRPAGEAKSVTFENQQQGALQWLQNLLKSIFGS